MKIEMRTSQGSFATNMKQGQAVTYSSQDAARAKMEVLQASAGKRGKFQDAYVQASREGSVMEQARFQQQNEETKQASSQANRVISHNTRDVTSVIASLITPPIDGKRSSLGQFLDRFA